MRTRHASLLQRLWWLLVSGIEGFGEKRFVKVKGRRDSARRPLSFPPRVSYAATCQNLGFSPNSYMLWIRQQML